MYTPSSIDVATQEAFLLAALRRQIVPKARKVGMVHPAEPPHELRVRSHVGFARAARLRRGGVLGRARRTRGPGATIEREAQPRGDGAQAWLEALELDDGVEARRARLDAHVGLDRLRVRVEELVRERLARLDAVEEGGVATRGARAADGLVPRLVLRAAVVADAEPLISIVALLIHRTHET